MKINGFDTSKKVLVIAEIGNNHEGSFETAVKMVEAAAESGADAVKFQTFRTEHYVHKSQKERVDRLKSFELSFEEFGKLAEITKNKGLLFISTPFDLESAKFLGGICDAIKISSSDNTFYPLLEAVAKTEKPVIVSTGLASFKEIEKLGSIFKNEFAMLHCICSYPANPEDINLRMIPELKKRFGCEVGYSDHSLGIEAAIASVAIGARILEKHFTQDKNFSDFRDHQLSADPEDFAKMVKMTRAVETMLGDTIEIVDCEKGNIIPLRRSIVASKPMKAGEILTESDITWVRPGGGLGPGEENKILNRKLKRDVESHETLAEDLFS